MVVTRSLSRWFLSTLACAVLASGLPASDAWARPSAMCKKKKSKKKGKKRKAAEEKAAAPAGPSAEEQQLDAAIRQFKDEDYVSAAVALHAISISKAPDKVRSKATYTLAKALHRLEMHHSALHYFSKLLAEGPESPYYRSVLEWCLFIARRIVSDDKVLEVVSRHSDGSFPEDYKSEFRYLLARYHYQKGLAIEIGAEVGSLGETKVEETVTGGVSLSGDVFSAGGDDDDDGGEPEQEGEEGVVKREGGGISLGEDIFGSDEPKAEEKPKPKEEKKVAEAPKADTGNLTAKEHFESAQRYAIQVDPKSEFSARAKFLEGVMRYRDGEENESLEAFKSVVRMTKPGAPQEDENLRQIAFFQLARTHFGAKQPTFSIFYYDKIERFTYDWLAAIYESSWAEFRLGRFEKALGNLLTLHSPFFTDQYFPESHILKAVVYYENCRYKEAKNILQAFLKRYEPVLEELSKQTERTQSADKYYEVLTNIRGGGEDIAGNDQTKARILSQILEIALSDRDLKRLDASYREVESEMKRYPDLGSVFAGSGLREDLEVAVGEVRAELGKEAGRAVKRKLERERDAIKELVQQAIRIDIETAAAEQGRIEQELVGTETKDAEKLGEFVDWTDDEKIVWPFEEEYWKDELGTYQLTLARSCKTQR